MCARRPCRCRSRRSPARRPRSSASCSGTISCSGRSAITTAAAWMELLRTMPSRPLGDVDDPLRVGVGVDGLAQLLAGLQAILEVRVAAHDRLGDHLRELVALHVRVAEHAGCVAGRRPRRHLAEGDDLRDRLAPVLLGDVADHALAAADREVDVDVRHRRRAGFRKRSKSRSLASGSRSVMLRQ